MILTPGPGYNPAEFAERLGEGIFVSERLDSEVYTDVLTEKLRHAEEAVICKRGLSICIRTERTGDADRKGGITIAHWGLQNR